MDDEPQQEDPVRHPLRQNDEQEDHDNAVALAAYYERKAAEYERDTAREEISASTSPQMTTQTHAAVRLAAEEEGELPLVPGT